MIAGGRGWSTRIGGGASSIRFKKFGGGVFDGGETKKIK